MEICVSIFNLYNPVIYDIRNAYVSHCASVVCCVDSKRQ